MPGMPTLHLEQPMPRRRSWHRSLGVLNVPRRPLGHPRPHCALVVAPLRRWPGLHSGGVFKPVASSAAAPDGATDARVKSGMDAGWR